MHGKLLQVTIKKDAKTGATTVELRWQPRNGVPCALAYNADCEFFVNGKKAQVGDLKAGDALEASGQPANSIKATR